MKIAHTLCGVFPLAVGLATAQPVITGGPVNAASYSLAGLPNAGIAPGSLFIVFGRNLGPGQLLSANSFPLPANLGPTSIRATVGGTTVNAIMIYTSAGQVAAILPSSTPVGDGTLTLNFNAVTSNAVPIHVVKTSVGIFTRNSAGSGPAIVQNFNSQTDTPLNTLVQATPPSGVVIAWATGLGGVNGNEAAGPLPAAVPAGVTVDVFAGGKPANVIGFGRSGCCAGIDQIAFTVPAGVEGCYVPVAIRTGGVVSNIATISVASNGRICSDQAGFSTAELQNLMQKQQSGGTPTIGDINLARVHLKLATPAMGTVEGNVEFANGAFRRYPALAASNSRTVAGLDVAGAPSVGSCATLQFPYGDLFDALLVPGGDPVLRPGLDAGATLNFSGPRGALQLPRRNEGGPGQPDYNYGVNGDVIGGGLPGLIPVQPEYEAPGSYTVDNGSGSPQVGAFRATLTIPGSQPVWTNQDSITNIPRSQDLTVTWSGGAAGGIVGIFGSSADTNSKAGVGFQCLVPADAGSFTVPAWVLSSLPASGIEPSLGVAAGGLSLGTILPQPSRFQATGIDLGFFNWGALQTKNVNFQ